MTNSNEITKVTNTSPSTEKIINVQKSKGSIRGHFARALNSLARLYNKESTKIAEDTGLHSAGPIKRVYDDSMETLLNDRNKYLEIRPLPALPNKTKTEPARKALPVAPGDIAFRDKLKNDLPALSDKLANAEKELKSLEEKRKLPNTDALDLITKFSHIYTEISNIKKDIQTTENKLTYFENKIKSPSNPKLNTNLDQKNWDKEALQFNKHLKEVDEVFDFKGFNDSWDFNFEPLESITESKPRQMTVISEPTRIEDIGTNELHTKAVSPSEDYEFKNLQKTLDGLKFNTKVDAKDINLKPSSRRAAAMMSIVPSNESNEKTIDFVLSEISKLNELDGKSLLELMKNFKKSLSEDSLNQAGIKEKISEVDRFIEAKLQEESYQSLKATLNSLKLKNNVDVKNANLQSRRATTMMSIIPGDESNEKTITYVLSEMYKLKEIDGKKLYELMDSLKNSNWATNSLNHEDIKEKINVLDKFIDAKLKEASDLDYLNQTEAEVVTETKSEGVTSETNLLGNLLSAEDRHYESKETLSVAASDLDRAFKQ